jgi:spore maturation protein CgeB
MKKPVSLRRQKKEVSLDTISECQKESQLIGNQEEINQLSNSLKKYSTDRLHVIEQLECLNAKFDSLEKKLNIIHDNIRSDLYTVRSENLKTIQDELKRLQTILISNITSIGKNEFSSIIQLLKFKKEDVDLERTLSYQLGHILIEGKKNIESLIRIPNALVTLKNESIKRKKKILTIKDENKLIDINKDKKIEKVKESISKIEMKDIYKQDYPLISYDYYKNFWPEITQSAKFISILDEISENSWQNVFKLFSLNKNNYEQQILSSSSNALFIESCWKGNKGAWEYAFTSPGLKHENAQKLLKSLEIAKSRKLPIIFWNKEDPMHYDKFLPIAEKCDVIFTTDINKVKDYQRDLPGKKVYPLVFAANPFICNPVNRNRYEQETICFAGSYYSVGHDDRKLQMDTLLPALLTFNGAIYDRMSALKNERYYFPEQYRHLIRDAVDFKTMSVLYKRFKIFLNVNTITDSPTMMSRRVYELLACGTPVISTPSKALEEQFSGIVQIAKNAEEAVRIANDLLQDEWKYKHLAHRGYREVMLKHTYQSRVKDILASIDIAYNNSPEKVSILMATMREHYIDRILENLSRQNYSNLEAFVVTQGFSKIGIQKLKDGIGKIKNIKKFQIIEENNNEISLGERLNKAASYATGTYLAKMDDDDFYFENYLTDMIIPFSFGNFGLVGKKEIFIYLEGLDKTIIRYKNQSHRITDFVFGATLVIKKMIFDKIGGFIPVNRGEDSSILSKLKDLKVPIYASDSFNFIAFRSKDSNHHTWQTEDDFFLKNAEVFEGFNSRKVII